MILAAFGLVDRSPIEISEILKGLKMSHSFVGGFGRTMHLTIDGLNPGQPVWPVVIDRVRAVPKVQSDKDRFVYFVCDSRAALSLSNVSTSLWPEHRILGYEDAIKQALMDAHGRTENWALSLNEVSFTDYVNQAAKPSFLNHIQSAIYKITPYPKRKEIQKACISYLAGGSTLPPLKRALKSNLRLADLLALMDSPEARNLREACAAMRRGTVEQVAKEFGVETFEIMFLVKSYAQNKG